MAIRSSLCTTPGHGRGSGAVDKNMYNTKKCIRSLQEALRVFPRFHTNDVRSRELWITLPCSPGS